MAKSYLIDTSIVIKYLNETLSDGGILFIDGIINENCTISFISEIELQVWNPPNEDDLVIYRQFVKNAYVTGIDEYIIASTIEIRNLYKLKLPDALIAGTALAHDITLVADNDKDFGRVPQLKYINPNK